MRKLLQKIARLKVVVVGDLALDHYIWGDSSRLSPEAPVPVVAVDNETYTAGMAALPALNLRAWNVGVEVCGVIGVMTSQADGFAASCSRPESGTITALSFPVSAAL